MSAEWFEKPVIKNASDIRAGDIIQCEFGDFDNIVKVVFDSCEADGKHTKVTCHDIRTGRQFDMYDFSPIDKVTFEVVGKVV